MAEQRQPFRFRLPWLPAPQPTPAAPRPSQVTQAPPQPAPAQRPPFRPAGVAPAQLPTRAESQPPSQSRTTSQPPAQPQGPKPSQAPQASPTRTPPQTQFISPARRASPQTQPARPRVSATPPPKPSEAAPQMQPEAKPQSSTKKPSSQEPKNQVDIQGPETTGSTELAMRVSAPEPEVYQTASEGHTRIPKGMNHEELKKKKRKKIRYALLWILILFAEEDSKEATLDTPNPILSELLLIGHHCHHLPLQSTFLYNPPTLLHCFLSFFSSNKQVIPSSFPKKKKKKKKLPSSYSLSLSLSVSLYIPPFPTINMARHERSSSRRRDKSSSSRRRHHRRSRDDDSDSDSLSDSYESPSDDSPPHRRRGQSRSSRRRRSPSPSDSADTDSRSGSDGGERGSDKTRKRKPTEEEIKEYLAKKAQKKALKVAKKLKTQTVSGYSNDSNPFGDSNLNEKFVWNKKIERDVAQGVPLDDFTFKAEKKRQRERMAEIEKVKKRREERALEKAQREEEMTMLQRERARAEADDFEKKEEEFHFDQSKIRSRIRLIEGRTKPIDVLTKYLDDSGDFDVELDEPYMVFKGLTVKEMEELYDDIKLHLDLDRATPTHIEYWEALMVVCEWELGEARRKDAIDRARVRGEHPPAELLAEERGLHSSIETDVRNFLEGRTYKGLVALQAQIESEMRSGKAKVVEYWEAVLKRLHIYKAKACLKEIHAKMLRRHLHRLEQPLQDENLKSEEDKTEEEEIEHTIEDSREFSPEPITYNASPEAEAEEGSFSPQLLHGEEAEEAIDPEEDRAILEEERLAVLKEQQRRMKEAMVSKPAPQPVDEFENRAVKVMGAMEEGDAVFGSGAEVNLDSQVYWWHDKYRPRKPKYFNRVHTGYEWNKYNQTHYDHDNPPPKIVQGYKFNIFYPDLVDKTKAPTYFIEKDGDSAETCIIRFHAGPPYEDIAFRIVNKEWEYSHKKGYKCTFERGILHVYFNFKRYRYRR